jgi:hypothetical protein
MTPAFRQIPTLLSAPIADIEDVEPGDICLVGLVDDQADRAFGARFAARQLRYASRLDGEPASADAQGRVLDLGDLNVFPLERERNEQALSRQIEAIVAKAAVPVVVGGAFTLAPLFRQVFERAAGREVATVTLPADDGTRVFTAPASDIVVMLDIAAHARAAAAASRPLARFRRQIEALPPPAIRAVQLTGLTPDLDLSGRCQSAFALHILSFIVAHLLKAGPQCR